MVNEPSPHTRTPNAKSDKLFEIIFVLPDGHRGGRVEKAD